jgi:hypothetical protein
MPTIRKPFKFQHTDANSLPYVQVLFFQNPQRFCTKLREERQEWRLASISSFLSFDRLFTQGSRTLCMSGFEVFTTKQSTSPRPFHQFFPNENHYPRRTHSISIIAITKSKLEGVMPIRTSSCKRDLLFSS